MATFRHWGRDVTLVFIEVGGSGDGSSPASPLGSVPPPNNWLTDTAYVLRRGQEHNLTIGTASNSLPGGLFFLMGCPKPGDRWYDQIQDAIDISSWSSDMSDHADVMESHDTGSLRFSGADQQIIFDRVRFFRPNNANSNIQRVEITGAQNSVRMENVHFLVKDYDIEGQGSRRQGGIYEGRNQFNTSRVAISNCVNGFFRSCLFHFGTQNATTSETFCGCLSISSYNTHVGQNDSNIEIYDCEFYASTYYRNGRTATDRGCLFVDSAHNFTIENSKAYLNVYKMNGTRTYPYGVRVENSSNVKIHNLSLELRHIGDITDMGTSGTPSDVFMVELLNNGYLDIDGININKNIMYEPATDSYINNIWGENSTTSSSGLSIWQSITGTDQRDRDFPYRPGEVKNIHIVDIHHRHPDEENWPNGVGFIFRNGYMATPSFSNIEVYNPYGTSFRITEERSSSHTTYESKGFKDLKGTGRINVDNVVYFDIDKVSSVGGVEPLVTASHSNVYIKEVLRNPNHTTQSLFSISDGAQVYIDSYDGPVMNVAESRYMSLTNGASDNRPSAVYINQVDHDQGWSGNTTRYQVQSHSVEREESSANYCLKFRYLTSGNERGGIHLPPHGMDGFQLNPSGVGMRRIEIYFAYKDLTNPSFWTYIDIPRGTTHGDRTTLRSGDCGWIEDDEDSTWTEEGLIKKKMIMEFPIERVDPVYLHFVYRHQDTNGYFYLDPVITID